MSEEYLADHFPNFPVMPGVLMLEAMTQASAWLVRAQRGLRPQPGDAEAGHQREVRPVRRAGADVDRHRRDPFPNRRRKRSSRPRARSTAGRSSAPGWCCERYNLADADPEKAVIDEAIVKDLRQTFRVLYQPAAPPAQTQP